MVKTLKSIGEEIGYAKQQFGMRFAALTSKGLVKGVIGAGAALFLASGVAAFGIAAAAGLGVGLLFRSRMYNQEITHKDNRLLNQYAPLIRSSLAQNGIYVPEKGLTRQHLDMAAELNPAFKQQMAQHRTMKRCKMAGYLATSLAVVGLLALMIPGAPVAAFLVGTGMASGGVAWLAALGSIPTYLTIKATLGKFVTNIATKQTGIDSPSVIKAVDTLKKEMQTTGYATPEQVMGTYVAANPELGDQITAQFGKPYHKLPQSEKTTVTALFSPQDLLENVEAINSKQFPPEEMAYRALPAHLGGGSSGYVSPESLSSRAAIKAKELKIGMGEKLADKKTQLDAAISSLKKNKVESTSIDSGVNTVSSPDIDNRQQWEKFVRNEQTQNAQALSTRS